MMVPCVIYYGRIQMVRHFRLLAACPLQTYIFFLRYQRMGSVATRCWIPLRCRRDKDIRPRERYRSYRTSPSARNGRLQTHVRQNDRHCLECAKLLLSVRSILLLYISRER